jgi:glycosyltransferase involved in cell wall biosynthesis
MGAPTPTARTLVVVGDVVDVHGASDRPRRDYEMLVERLGADMLHAGDAGAFGGRGRSGWALARAVSARSDAYDNIYCDSEHIGMPLAFLLARKRRRPRLTMIAHYLTPLKKRMLLRALRLPRAIDQVVVHSPAQAARAREVGFREAQISPAPYQVDAAYWQRDAAAQPSHIVSAGQEFRDYRTMLSAVDGLDVPVRIAAGSHWSSRRSNVDEQDVPANVTIGRLSYSGLRDAYARAHFVVVPLHDVDFQAGIITILEAMAMGKAVIVSKTRGQTGVVTGPLMRDGALLESGEHAWREPTGFYVPPGDPQSLRAAIEYLLAHPDQARRMGEAARRHVEAALSIEHFVARLAPIIDPPAVRDRATVAVPA